MEDTVESYASWLEFTLGVKIPVFVKELIRSDFSDAYLTNNTSRIETINTRIAELPKLRRMDERELELWRSEAQLRFIPRLFVSNSPLSKAILNLHLKPEGITIDDDQNVPEKMKSDLKKTTPAKDQTADAYSIEGLWSKRESGSTQPINDSSSFVFGIFRFYQSYRFLRNGTFEQIISSKTTVAGDKDSVTKGNFRITGDQIRLTSPEDVMLFRFMISNRGKTLTLEALDDYSRAFSGEFDKEE